MCVCMCTWEGVCVCACVHGRECVCVCMHACVTHAWVGVCVSVFWSTHTHTHTHTHTDDLIYSIMYFIRIFSVIKNSIPIIIFVSWKSVYSVLKENMF